MSAPTPSIVGTRPASSSRERRTASSTANAACGPTRSVIATEICPLAASSPNTIPTIATMMITSGARENSVQNPSAAACSNASSSSQCCAAVRKIWRGLLRCIPRDVRTHRERDKEEKHGTSMGEILTYSGPGSFSKNPPTSGDHNRLIRSLKSSRLLPPGAWIHQAENCLVNHIELTARIRIQAGDRPPQCSELSGEIGLRVEQFASLHERAHDIHAHLHGACAIQNGGGHDGPMLGEGQRKVLAVAAVFRS